MSIARHSLFNLVGLAAPLVVALFTIPMLIRELGEARFGLLTLLWAVVSYFGLFDLGLGRALTQQIAVALSKQRERSVGPLVATAIGVMSALGLLAGALMAWAAPSAVSLVRGVQDPQEVVRAVDMLALAMPAIVLTSAFRGVMEARHAFGAINLIRVPMGLFTFVAPLIVVYWLGPRLDWIAAVLSGGRVIACVAHGLLARRSLPVECRNWRFDAELLKPLCTSGGWLTLSNVISPFMGYVDRFVIGALVSATAVAYYATPNEIVTKLWIVPGALTAVLFPTFAAQLTRSAGEVQALFKQAVRWLFWILLPVTAALAVFAHQLLDAWVGAEFAHQSAPLLQVFAFGMLFNCMAHVPFTLIQSTGAARMTALIHAAELPFFVLALWLLTAQFGLIGAALAWLLRIVADTVLMFTLCFRLLDWPASSFFGRKAAAL